jgi:hypothetical protein
MSAPIVIAQPRSAKLLDPQYEVGLASRTGWSMESPTNQQNRRAVPSRSKNWHSERRNRRLAAASPATTAPAQSTAVRSANKARRYPRPNPTARRRRSRGSPTPDERSEPAPSNRHRIAVPNVHLPRAFHRSPSHRRESRTRLKRKGFSEVAKGTTLPSALCATPRSDPRRSAQRIRRSRIHHRHSALSQPD